MGKRLHQRIKMKTVFALLAFACLAAFASANPVERTGCSITELLECQNEINQAMADCGHLNSIQEIQTCINDILAATDCQKCICENLHFRGLHLHMKILVLFQEFLSPLY